MIKTIDQEGDGRFESHLAGKRDHITFHLDVGRIVCGRSCIVEKRQHVVGVPLAVPSERFHNTIGLTHIGRYPTAWHSGTATGKTLREVTSAVLSLADKEIGALIAIERNVGLNNYAEGGVPMDAKVSAPLIETIFYEGTALHDGAIIVQNGRISAAGCFLPLSESELKHTFGTRHRAAVGLSEETDALVVVVSEETGAVRIAFDGRLTGALNKDNLLTTLENMFAQGLRKGPMTTRRQGEPDEA